MKQLQNVLHNFDTPINQVGVTIRIGPKWGDNHTSVGTLLELRMCENAHNNGICHNGCEIQGLGLKLGSWYGMVKDLPPALLALEHNERARDLGTLYKMLEDDYPDFDGDTYVTALIYLRIS